MRVIKLTCADYPGAAARITGALRGAGISARGIYFTTTTERYGLFNLRTRTVGEGEIVVKDEDWDMMGHQLQKLTENTKKENRKDLALKISRPYYRVTVQIPDQSGGLDDPLQEIAKHNISVRQIITAEPDADGMVLSRIVFECELKEYDLAKRLLKRWLQKESPYLATAVRDL